MFLDDSPLLFSRCRQFFRDGSPPNKCPDCGEKTNTSWKSVQPTKPPMSMRCSSPQVETKFHTFLESEWVEEYWWDLQKRLCEIRQIHGFSVSFWERSFPTYFRGAEFWDVPKCVCGLLNRLSFFRNFQEICTCSNTYRFKACHLEVRPASCSCPTSKPYPHLPSQPRRSKQEKRHHRKQWDHQHDKRQDSKQRKQRDSKQHKQSNSKQRKQRDSKQHKQSNRKQRKQRDSKQRKQWNRKQRKRWDHQHDKRQDSKQRKQRDSKQHKQSNSKQRKQRDSKQHKQSNRKQRKQRDSKQRKQWNRKQRKRWDHQHDKRQDSKQRKQRDSKQHKQSNRKQHKQRDSKQRKRQDSKQRKQRDSKQHKQWNRKQRKRWDRQHDKRQDSTQHKRQDSKQRKQRDCKRPWPHKQGCYYQHHYQQRNHKHHKQGDYYQHHYQQRDHKHHKQGDYYQHHSLHGNHKHHKQRNYNQHNIRSIHGTRPREEWWQQQPANRRSTPTRSGPTWWKGWRRWRRFKAEGWNLDKNVRSIWPKETPKNSSFLVLAFPFWKGTFFWDRFLLRAFFATATPWLIADVLVMSLWLENRCLRSFETSNTLWNIMKSDIHRENDSSLSDL